MQARAVVPLRLVPYGAQELKQVARSYMARSVMAGSATWLIAFLMVLGASVLLWRPSQQIVVPLPPSIDITTPPSLERVEPPLRLPFTTPAAPAKAGIAVPVLGVEAPLNQTIPSQAELEVRPPGAGAGGDRAAVVPPAGEAPLPRPDEWVNVDELPEAVTRVEPEYPEIAKEAGVEGTVVVRALVGKDGRVRDAFVEPKYSVPMLDEAAIKAARRWLFTPALTNGRPIPVWVTIPMRFTLR